MNYRLGLAYFFSLCSLALHVLFLFGMGKLKMGSEISDAGQVVSDVNGSSSGRSEGIPRFVRPIGGWGIVSGEVAR